MNYCCAMGNCRFCIERHARICARVETEKAREKMRVLLGNAVHPPEKQNIIRHEVVREYPPA